MEQKKSKRAWIVVQVISGIPLEVEAFRYKKSAEKREKLLRKTMHPENDEIGLFEVEI